jgi:hypothetical protein
MDDLIDLLRLAVRWERTKRQLYERLIEDLAYPHANGGLPLPCFCSGCMAARDTLRMMEGE